MIGGAALVVAAGQAVRTDIGWLDDDERALSIDGPSSFDASTGFRASTLAILESIPEGATVGGWQSGALGYYGTGRTVVNLDGAVNPDAAGLSQLELAAYLRDRRVEWFADSVLVVPVAVAIVGRLDVPPLVVPGPVVRPGRGSPDYAAVELRWR